MGDQFSPENRSRELGAIGELTLGYRAVGFVPQCASHLSLPGLRSSCARISKAFFGGRFEITSVTLML
jgi:hypothetical protein